MTDLSEYELKRKRNLEENQDLLRELGLISSKNPKILSKIKNPKLWKPKTTIKTEASPHRLSRRIRGQIPEEIAEIVDDDDNVKFLKPIVKSRKVNHDDRNIPSNLNIPLTLRSIGTTIWSLGKLHTGKGRTKMWSSRGCKYSHPYPIGYEATKSHFGKDYKMKISLDSNGDIVFSVQTGTITYTGGTPTAPWTQACINSRCVGARVSGPLFFGFSDPITISMIEKMNEYEKSNEPE